MTDYIFQVLKVGAVWLAFVADPVVGLVLFATVVACALDEVFS